MTKNDQIYALISDQTIAQLNRIGVLQLVRDLLNDIISGGSQDFGGPEVQFNVIVKVIGNRDLPSVAVIRVVREVFSVGLKEAKDLFDGVRRNAQFLEDTNDWVVGPFATRNPLMLANRAAAFQQTDTGKRENSRIQFIV